MNSRWLILVAILLTTLVLLRVGAIIPAGLTTLLIVFYPTIDKLVIHYFVKPEPEKTQAQSNVQADPALMTRKEAIDILGLSEKPTRDEINQAYKRLMMRNHPDQGGTDYLAAKINLAKQLLLDEIG